MIDFCANFSFEFDFNFCANLNSNWHKLIELSREGVVIYVASNSHKMSSAVICVKLVLKSLCVKLIYVLLFFKKYV